jgi:DNA-binding NtrC family response regulator
VTDTIVADRFVLLPDGVRDVATDHPVWLRIEQAGDADTQRAWCDRATALATLHHRWLAPCLDFGSIGDGRRFEAFALPEPVSVAAETMDAQRARRAVALFLGAAGVPAGRLSVMTGPCGPVVVPGALGTTDATPERCLSHAFLAAGVQVRDTALRSALGELLREEPPPGVSLLRVAVPIGGGGRTLLRDAARMGRLAGWLPLAAAAFSRWRREAAGAPRLRIVSGRHVLLLHDARGARSDASVALGLVEAATTGMPWRLLQLVEPDAARAVLRWQPMSADALAALVIAPADPSVIARRVRAAAERSGGLPGAFVAALDERGARHSVPVSRSLPGLVHETPSSYAAGEAPGLAWRPANVDGPTAASEALRVAERLARRGRASAGDRWLRRSAGRLDRRGQHAAAADVLLASARHALERGRPIDSLHLLDQVQSNARRADLAEASIVAGAWRGRALVDVLELDRALAVLRSTMTAAEVYGVCVGRRWAAVALARALCLAGRAAEAEGLLAVPGEAASQGLLSADAAAFNDSNLLLAIVEQGSAARVALARGRPGAAVAHAATAGRLARDTADRAARMAALSIRVRLQAGFGDHEALLDQLPNAIALCREMRLPLQAVKYRLATLEACVRGGLRAESVRLARALRLAERAVPPLLAARVALARAAAHGHIDARARDRLVSSGFGRLVSQEFPSWRAATASDQRSAMIDEVMEVIRVCQEREEPNAALQEIADVLRKRLDATVALILSKPPGGVVVSSPPQFREALASAQRALEHGVPIVPQEVALGHEAALPVRYGGLVVGAVACRWVAGTPVDRDRAVRLLGAAAAALGPALRSLVDEGERPVAPQIEADILGVSDGMAAVRRTIAQAADAPFPVMVYGESGVGKELVARALHRAGARRARAFCAINCAALPDDLLEAELFGHVRGAFTGATADRRGLFEEADGGVLFLDEVGELSARGQAKLLRVLQEHEVRRLGETQSRRIDVRVVAATNRSLEQEVEHGRFRRDLRYRLDVIRIVVPPVRERPEDVPVLVAALWPRIAGRMGSRAGLSDACIAALARYDWPGNVRELQNVLAALAVSAPRRGAIGPSGLPAALARAAVESSDDLTLDQARRRFEERFVRAALARAGGHRGRAAASLGITRQGLSKLLGRLGVEVPVPVQGDGAPAAHTS